MKRFAGGSEQRHRHGENLRFIYTEGVKAVAETAGANWLVDTVATQLAPLFAKRWLAGEASIGVVTLEVFPYEPGQPRAVLTLGLGDSGPPVATVPIQMTDFPQGAWTFFLGTDEVGDEKYVTTMMVPSEY